MYTWLHDRLLRIRSKVMCFPGVSPSFLAVFRRSLQWSRFHARPCRSSAASAKKADGGTRRCIAFLVTTFVLIATQAAVVVVVVVAVNKSEGFNSSACSLFLNPRSKVAKRKKNGVKVKSSVSNFQCIIFKTRDLLPLKAKTAQSHISANETDAPKRPGAVLMKNKRKTKIKIKLKPNKVYHLAVSFHCQCCTEISRQQNASRPDDKK